MFKYITRHMKRSIVINLIIAVLSGFILIFMNYLNQSLKIQYKQLDEIHQNSIVECVVTDAWGHDNALRIYQPYVDHLTHSDGLLTPYVSNPAFSCTLQYSTAALAGDLIGINRWESMPVMATDGGKVVYYEGYSADSLLGEDKLVWLPFSALEGLSEQSTITLNIEIPVMHGRGSANEEFIIAGYYTGLFTDTIFIPWKAMLLLIEEHQVTYTGIVAESIRFTIQDNYKLREFKDAARKLFTDLDTSSLEYWDLALTVHDSLFLQTILSVYNTIDTLELLIPLCRIFVFVLGFILGFIYNRNRLREIYLLQVIGMSSRKIFLIMLVEFLVAVIAGLLLVAIVVLLMNWHFNIVLIVELLVYVSLGSSISIYLRLRRGLLSIREE